MYMVGTEGGLEAYSLAS